MQGWIAVAAALAVAAAGCVGGPPASALQPDDAAAADPAPRVAVVVADLGGGGNPYHELHRRPTWLEHPSTLLPGFPPDVPALNLTFGEDYQANLEADEAVWSAVETGRLYWIPGTNLLSYSHRPYASVPVGHGGPSTHGVATVAAVTAACMDCYVLYIQDVESLDGASLELIADQMPWVDFVVSTNFPGEVQYGQEFPYVGGSPAYQHATRRLHEQGRLFFAATGNTPVNGLVNPTAPYPIFDYNHPPWVVNVGGAQSGCGSAVQTAGTLPELVGDFTQELPRVETTTEDVYPQGTSFATPQVAGRAGAVLQGLRERLGDTRDDGALWAGDAGPGPFLEDGRITQEEIRFVLQRSAEHFTTTEFDPLGTECMGQVSIRPVGPAPVADLGWGYPSQATVDAAIGQLLGESEVPQRDQITVEAMQAQMALRHRMYP